ncbi:MAG: acetate--CoA ligase family protein [Acidimicrobiia bacterium]
MVDSARTDVSGRPLQLRDVDLDRFLHPKTVAVIGASEADRKPNSAMTRKFKAWADRNGAEFLPVHPKYDKVLGEHCYSSIHEIIGDIDLAIILTGAAVDTYEDVISRDPKPKFAVIFAAGFSEIGAEGEKLQARLEQLVHDGGVNLMGPNTNLNAFEPFRDDLPGPAIALITQSGHQGRPVFQGQEIGIRLSHWAPTGNEVDLEFADFARYFADQPEVGVVACYIEGFKDGRTLMLAADHAAKLKKPMVMVKVGRTDEGQSMAKAHTGHLTGSDAVTSAVFRQFGVTRVDGLDELLEVSASFARTTPPTKKIVPGRSGDGLVVYAISGGTGAHMADMAADAGLRLPKLTPATQKALHDGLIPSYLRVSNPVDCGGPPVADERGRKILDLILADPNCDLLIVPITGAVEHFSARMVPDLIEVNQVTDKPIFVIWGAPPGTDDKYPTMLLNGGIPTFRTFGNCVKAVKAYQDYWQFIQNHHSPFADAPTEPLPAAKKVRAIIAEHGSRGALSEYWSKQVLKAYGIKTSKDVLANSATEAVRAAKDLGLPVVMKVSSPDLLHKSDAGLVEVGLDSIAAVRATYDSLLRKAKRANKNAEIDGVLVCEMVRDGTEMVVGVSADPLFGPVVMTGLGGIFVEIFKDVSFRVPPFDADEVDRMLGELQGLPLLQGARGRRPGDIGALRDTILKVQRLAMDCADVIAELDVNPLVVKPRGVVALDALVVPK